MMAAPGTGGCPSVDQHRRGAGRIEHEEILAPLPHPLLDRARGEAVLAEREADEAGMRAERVMEQRQHADLLKDLRRSALLRLLTRFLRRTGRRPGVRKREEGAGAAAGRHVMSRRSRRIEGGRSILCNVRRSPLPKG